MTPLLAWWATLPLASLHWLRPEWLLAAVPALLLAWCLCRLPPPGLARWQQHIDAALLPALLRGATTSAGRWPIHILLVGWILACLALAGPAWEKSNANALKRVDALVILLDLSPSMLAQDVAPSRLQAAQYKILDLLKQRREGYTALVAYSGSAHVVAPLSDDANTIAALVPTLEPGVMPVLGSQTEDGIAEAIQLVKNAHFPRARFLLVTDGVDESAFNNIRSQLSGQPFSLNIIGVGTAQGGTVPLKQGAVLRDATGQPRLFTFDNAPLRELAANTGGQYSDLALDDSDIAPVISPESQTKPNDPTRDNDKRELEQWLDAGYWLVLPLLALALLAFRRGMLLACVLPFALCWQPSPANALDWDSWWLTPDQQAQRKLEQQDATAAAQLFTDSQWKAYAEYQSGQHDKAAEHFASQSTAAAHYNRGNALARNGQLQEALHSYEQALTAQPDFDDASFNQSIVKKLLEQQKKQEQQKQQNQGQQNQDQQSQQQNSPSSQNQGDQSQQNGDASQQAGQQQSNQPSNQQQSGQQSGDQQPSNQPTGDPSQSTTGQNPGEQGDNASGNGSSPSDQNDPLNKDPARQNATNEAPPASTPPSSPASTAEPSADQQPPAGDTTSAEAAEAEKPAKPASTDPAQSAQANAAESPEAREKRQATEQWLRKVPDDPGGLLRNKFEYYYQQKQHESGRTRRTVENDRW